VEEEDGYAQLSCAFERVVESRCGKDDFDVFFEDFCVVDDVFGLVSSTVLMMGNCLVFFSLFSSVSALGGLCVLFSVRAQRSKLLNA
jgi:hypothetical protein